jgi:hypothetical protein
MPGIFMSYRREYSIGHAGRLYGRLAARSGRERVFMDVDTIDFGVNLVEAALRGSLLQSLFDLRAPLASGDGGGPFAYRTSGW